MKIILVALAMLFSLSLTIPLLYFVCQADANYPVPPAVSSDSDRVEKCERFSDDKHALPLIEQNPELPNGCEVTSLAMLLAWAGAPIDKTELSENYLMKESVSDTGPDPDQFFVGNPADDDGWYCFEGPILEAGNAYLSEQSSQYRAFSLTGISKAALERYLDAGTPLAVWVTKDYSEPVKSSVSGWFLADGSWYIPYTNLHCVVLTGWDGGEYRVADPLSGWKSVAPDRFWPAFDSLGQRAVALMNGKTAGMNGYFAVKDVGDTALTLWAKAGITAPP